MCGGCIGAEGQNKWAAASDPCARAIQNGCYAHLPVQRGDQEPVYSADWDSGGDRGSQL